MSTEDREADRLREAMRAHTESVHPTGTFEDVRERAAVARRARRLRVTALSGLAAAAAVAVAVLALSTFTGDDTGQDVNVGPADPGTSTTEPDPTVSSVPGPGTIDETSPFVFVTEETDPRVAAERFAVEYLGMRDPIVGEFQQGGPDDGEVEVQAKDPGAVTVVGLREVGEDNVWGVTFAASDNIRVATPGPMDSVTSPVTVTGEALAFEGTVQVEVREDGQRFGERLGESFVTGGGGGEHGPFEGEIEFGAPEDSDEGAVVFYTTSAEDGSVWEASVVRVRFAGPAASDADPVELIVLGPDGFDVLDAADGSLLYHLGRFEGYEEVGSVDLGPDGSVWAVLWDDDECGGEVVRLLEGPGGSAGPPLEVAEGRDVAVSPDGTRIAFVRAPLCPFDEELVVRDLRSGDEQVVWGDANGEPGGHPNVLGNPAWSADGEMLAFEVADEASRYVTVARLQDQGATFVTLRPDGVSLSSPAWLPSGSLAIVEDGSTIAIYAAEALDGGIGGVERDRVLAEIDGTIDRLEGGRRGLLVVTGRRLLTVDDGGAVSLLATGYHDAAW
jgi:hypothetical protein